MDAHRGWSDALANAGRPVLFSGSAPAYFQQRNEAAWHTMIRFPGSISRLWSKGRDTPGTPAPNAR